MNSIYELHDGMHWPHGRLYLLNKYYKYVSGTVLNLRRTSSRYLSGTSEKCDKEMSEWYASECSVMECGGKSHSMRCA